MEGGENHAKYDKDDHYAAHRLQCPVPLQTLKNNGGKLERQHGGVKHHAEGNLEHDRVRVAHDERMPDVPGQSEVVHEGDAYQQVAHERGENGGPHYGMPALDVEDLYCGGQGEAAGGQHDAAHHVEADPEPPGELVAEIGGSAKPIPEADPGGVHTSRHDEEEDGLPEGESERQFGLRDHHCAPPFAACLSSPWASASATSSRRCVIQ